MNKILIATLFALLAISAHGTARTDRTAGVACATTSGTTVGCSACAAANACTAATGYYVLSGAADTPVSCPKNCASCASGAAAPTLCATCYGADTNYDTTTRGTGAAAAGNGSCTTCATGFIKDTPTAPYACITPAFGDCYGSNFLNGWTAETSVACVATGVCLTGYSDVSTGVPTATNLAADCKYCATGYTDSSTGAAATSPTAGKCNMCVKATHSWTSGSATRVCGLHADACVAGWTDSATGGAVTSPRVSGTAGCIYCLTGKITDGPTVPYSCIDPSAACSTGNVKNGGNATQTGYACVAKTGAVCLDGWTADATTGACTVAASSGNILMVSVAVLLSIIMIVF